MFRKSAIIRITPWSHNGCGISGRSTCSKPDARRVGRWKIDAVMLQVKATVPGIDAAQFKELAENAKANCPVSKLLNAKITLKADLV